MAIYPGAFYVPLSNYMKADRKRTTFNKVVLHTAVSNSRSLEGQFRDYNRGVCSHFYVDRSGNVEQYIDTDFKSNADFEGNGSSISIETWDGGQGVSALDEVINRKPWTDDQVGAIARLINWISVTHKIPMTAITNSLPTSRGVGYHRLGVDPWRVNGGETWSKDRGKICPGDARISQINGIISTARGVTKWVTHPPLRIDGSLGPATIARWQKVMGTPITTNAWSAPKTLVTAVQKHLNARGFNLEVDGYGIYQNGAYTNTHYALQEYLKVGVRDGIISTPVSSTIYALQDRLTRGWF